MLKRLRSHLDDMMVAFLIWMCTLPLVGLLVVPFFGWRVGLAVAGALFIAVMAICWGICGWKFFRQ